MCEVFLMDSLGRRQLMAIEGDRVTVAIYRHPLRTFERVDESSLALVKVPVETYRDCGYRLDICPDIPLWTVDGLPPTARRNK